jgi:SAM-dependent methyltransferase
MKLSEVTILLDFLAKANLDTAWIEYSNRLHTVLTHVANHQLQIGTVSQDIVNAMHTLESGTHSFRQSLNYLKAQLEQVIAHREPEYYQDSTRLYEEEMRWETNDYILNRHLIIDPETSMLMRNRIKNYSDWRLPGMIIRPGLETHIEEMVPLDPLYVVDQHQDLIKPAVEKFTAEYQRRLRQYIIDDYTSHRPLQELPDNQFGLIFAYNFFNYKPIEVIERYLRGFFEKLRPGGVAMFTFNNCDLPQGMGLAEKHFMCYTTGRRVLQIVDNIGFETVFDQRGPNNISWLEIKKPGKIVSYRGGQTLAKIVRK